MSEKRGTTVNIMLSNVSNTKIRIIMSLKSCMVVYVLSGAEHGEVHALYGKGVL